MNSFREYGEIDRFGHEVGHRIVVELEVIYNMCVLGYDRGGLLILLEFKVKHVFIYDNICAYPNPYGIR